MFFRHQIFVIARVGKHHRCLAVVHHQGLYDVFALKSCLRLIDVFSAKSTRSALESELHLAEQFYRGHPAPTMSEPDYEAHGTSPVRFPFIATCLILGSSLDLADDPRRIGRRLASLEPEDVGFDQSQNETGITVLDITDLDNVRYCFAAWRRLIGDVDADSDQDQDDALEALPSFNKPWSASEYSQHSCAACNWADELDDYPDPLPLAAKLDRVPLIRGSTLADVWPWGYWIIDPPGEAHTAEERFSGDAGGASLRDQALAKLVRSLLLSGVEDTRLLDEPMRLPDFKNTLRDHLFAIADDIRDTSGTPGLMGLLRAAFAGETFLDWARLPHLTPETIIAASGVPELTDVRELSLCPDWSSTTAPALAQAICAFPHLEQVYVMEAPGRSNEGPVAEFYKALAANPGCPKGKIWLSGAASCAIKQRMWLPAAEPFHPPPSFPVQQLVVVHPTWPYPTDLLPGPQSPPVYYFPLADAFLTPSRFVDGLLRVFARHLAYKTVGDWLASAAFCFTCATPNLDNPHAVDLGPLPAEIYTVARTVHLPGIKDCFPKMRDLVPGTWTVLVNAELLRPQAPDRPVWGSSICQNFFQCVFVRPRDRVIKADPEMADSFGADDLDVLDLDGFLRAAAPDVDIGHVNQGLEELEEAGKRFFVGEALQGRPRFSRAPVDAETACGWLKQALRRLRSVRMSYQTVLLKLYGHERQDEFWYPELNLQPNWQREPRAV